MHNASTYLPFLPFSFSLLLLYPKALPPNVDAQLLQTKCFPLSQVGCNPLQPNPRNALHPFRKNKLIYKTPFVCIDGAACNISCLITKFILLFTIQGDKKVYIFMQINEAYTCVFIDLNIPLVQVILSFNIGNKSLHRKWCHADF